MFSALRKRISTKRPEPFGKAGLTVAILALVMALVGGAYAAGGLTKSQEKQVTKIAKKYAGKPGATGSVGPAGANGTNGKDGAPGTPGKDGTSVTSTESNTTIDGTHCTGVGGSKFVAASGTTYACNGKNGTTGFTETLPAGKTETGAWFGNSGTTKTVRLALSFPIPLPTAIPPSHVHVVTFGSNVAGCSGTPSQPEAEEGNLCLFEGELSASEPLTGGSGTVIDPGSNGAGGAGTTGAFFLGIPATEENTIYVGTFAVTAE